MNIERIGHGAKYYPTNVNLDKPSIYWNKSKGFIEVHQTRLKDFSGNSHHDYTIQISLSELSEIIKLVGGETLNNISNEVSQNLSSALREIMRIQLACIGNVEQPK